MRGAISEPTRLREQRDPADLVERIAGQAARDAAEPEPLSRAALDRIAARIDARGDGKHGLLPLSWALVVGAFLLGIVTAASAARLDLLPSWLGSLVPGVDKHGAPDQAPAAGRRRAPAPKQTLASVSPATTNSQSETAPATQGAFGSGAAPAEPRSPAAGLAIEPSKQETEPSGRRESDLLPTRPRRLGMLAERTLPSSISPKRGLPVHATAPAEERPAGRPIAERLELIEPSAGPSAGLAGERVPAAPAREARPDLTPEKAIPAEAPAFPMLAASDPSTARPAVAASRATAFHPLETASLLKQIVRALRVERAPRRALALLDQHGDELAGQAFAEEALLLRVEAMLALGERAAVLRLLDQTPLTEFSVSRDLLLTRGELRAAADRCAEGIGDFDLVLLESRRPPRNALLGRARCRQKLGDRAGAQADLDRFRREFPGDSLP
jgi:hypothetical protein